MIFSILLAATITLMLYNMFMEIRNEIVYTTLRRLANEFSDRCIAQPTKLMTFRDNFLKYDYKSMMHDIFCFHWYLDDDCNIKRGKPCSNSSKNQSR